VGPDQEVLELHGETLAPCDHLRGNVLVSGQVGEEEKHAERIVQVSERIDESRVALLDNVVQLELGCEVLLEACGIANIVAAESFANLLRKGFLVAELGQKRLVEQVLDVLCVVEGGGGGGGLVHALPVARLTWVDTLEDTQSSEIWEGKLEFADGLGAGNVVFGVAGGAWE